MKINGTWKTIGVIISVMVAVGSIVWSVAIRSDNLDDLIKDVAEHEEKYEKVEVRVNTVEKAVIKIETNQEHMMKKQEEILYEIRK
ncbi:hypothetical protein LCGC14_0390600 [marine sediment metagenome]|uniref:Uncharacterized protein n=1 Tax=marine sediment metagenome TaxID=412755 RepID=A0A0F9SZV4_9ZZZZ